MRLVSFVSRRQQCYEHSAFSSDRPEIFSRKKNLWKTVLNYTKYLNNFNESQYRLKFLRKCLVFEITPNFLWFRGPNYGVFSDQAVHSFQLKLLRSEILNYLGQGKRG